MMLPRHLALCTKGGLSHACIADITSYSTENSKHITTGDGGIVVTNDTNLAEKMRKFGSLGYAALKAKDGRIRSNKDIFRIQHINDTTHMATIIGCQKLQLRWD